MVIQSLSIAVPATCPNNCRFCVSHMHEETYENNIEKNRAFRDLYKRDYYDRLAFARDNGCNTLMFTGSGEAITNKTFMEMVSDLNQSLPKPFRNLELQTSGILLNDDSLRWLRNTVRISTISLSLSCIWDSAVNARYCQTPEVLQFDIDTLCNLIKKYDFNLRLSLNMTDQQIRPNDIQMEIADLFKRTKTLEADQVTFRRLYTSTGNSPENDWIMKHQVDPIVLAQIQSYIKTYGHPLERLPYGALRYSVQEMSCVIDDDSMSCAKKDEIKYLVLRPNCKLYTKWDDKGSLLF